MIGHWIPDQASIYSDLATLTSVRPACDPRLPEAAEICYDSAFSSNGVFTGLFCGDGTFTIDDVKEKCLETNCGEVIGAVNQAGDFKEAILVGITLLIEDAFRNQNSVWKTRIPGEIKVAEYQTLVCEPKCPNPSVWSSWNCWCEESAAPGETNDLNLPDCKCGNQKRYRVQTCTTVTGGSCEMYHTPTRSPNFEVCENYGNRDFLALVNGVSVNSVLYRSDLTLRDFLDYNGDTTDDTLVAQFYQPNSAFTACNYGYDIVDENDFRAELASATGRFSFTVEEGTCSIAKVGMKVEEGSCDKTCGCGTFQRTSTCHYMNDDGTFGDAVPTDSDDYTCGCQENKVESVACAMNCCNAWHQCASNGNCNEASPDSAFILGQLFNYPTCTKECGAESTTAEIRCMCENKCNYAADVIIETPVPTGWDRFPTTSCAENVVIASDTLDNKDNVGEKYRAVRTQDCENPCCVTIETNAGTCPDLNCYDADKSRPWFVQTSADGSCSANKMYRGSKQCVCDTAGTSTSVKCVDTATGTEYTEGQSFAPSTNPADRCDYLRKDYINYNDYVNALVGKNDNDDYFCCTEENENDLFHQWSNWDDSACVVAGNTCGCYNDGEESCGLKTRRRELKCPDYKVDETTCPCVEVKKCHLPKCPKQGPFMPTSTCKLDASLDNNNFQVRQCCNEDAAYTLPWDFVAGNQFTKDTCNWCPCNDQVGVTPVVNVCPAFEKDCDGLVWDEWGTCTLDEGHMCGVGKQSRMRKCPGATTLEEVQNHCYNPHVRRHVGVPALMTDHPDYFEERQCVVACPNYGPWTACSGAPGQSGMQIRFDLDHTEKYDVKSCVSGLGGAMKDPETHFGHCNVACGMGKRHKIVHDFSTGVTSITEEDCEMPACTAEIESCPEIVVEASTTAAQPASTTAAKTTPAPETTPLPVTEPAPPVTIVSTTVKDNKGVTVGGNDVVVVDAIAEAVIGETITGEVVGTVVNGVVTGDVSDGVIIDVSEADIGENATGVVSGKLVNSVLTDDIVSGIIIRPATKVTEVPEIITVTADAMKTVLSIAFAILALLI